MATREELVAYVHLLESVLARCGYGQADLMLLRQRVKDAHAQRAGGRPDAPHHPPPRPRAAPAPTSAPGGGGGGGARGPPGAPKVRPCGPPGAGGAATRDDGGRDDDVIAATARSPGRKRERLPRPLARPRSPGPPSAIGTMIIP